ncbi:MAG TPA: hypothetical protein VN426_09890, partial [Syntrophomonadaceae bacterium]|nr:hypothetical protein [Syntrophomonadaceae bacterium]
IRYLVEADISCNFDFEDDAGYETTEIIDKHEFVIYYHLEDDNFYIKEYDDAGLGRTVFDSDDVELEAGGGN